MSMAKKNRNLQQIGNIWYFIRMVNGKRIKKALSPSLTEARRERDRLLKEIHIYGNIQKNQPVPDSKLFGEVAQQWVKIKARKVKSSTLRDYRGAMNYYVLPRFGNVPISDIGYLDIEEFISELECSPKRINNILVPMRSLLKFALKADLIDRNPMDLVENLTVSKPDIFPLSMEEVQQLLDHVSPRYKNFFAVAFFTGMRFGEMAALKWKNVDFKLGVTKIRETRVRGEEGRPKTKKSVRDVKILSPVIEAFRNQRKYTMGKSDYVFLNQYGRPLLPDSVNQHVWKPALKKAGLNERSLYHTRHTFATLMLDAGELPGWVQHMMGHQTLQMIHERYYSHIKNSQRGDGSAFIEKVYNPSFGLIGDDSSPERLDENFTPNLHQTKIEELGCNPNSSILLEKSVS